MSVRKPGRPKRFRVLTIGKSGCGKTTILSKVCGINMVDAPSTSRGVHDIEKEIIFEGNDMMVAHDSEGFEAGQSNELDVVRQFIENRSMEEDLEKGQLQVEPEDRLHMIWYCIEMNSRPIQSAENIFFSIKWKVPVLVVVTKFDVFVQGVLQKLEEAEDDDDDVDEEKLQTEAEKQANELFETHLKAPLMGLKHPPKAVLALSEIHKATLKDSRLSELVRKTVSSLDPLNSIDPLNPLDPLDLLERTKLAVLFASAQKVDIETKVWASIEMGFIDNYSNYDLGPPFSIKRAELVKTWNTSWSEDRSASRFNTLVTALNNYVDELPHTIGNPGSLDLPEINKLTPARRKFCRCAQMVADTTVIMEHVFLLPVEDEVELEDLVKFYGSSTVATQIRNEIIQVMGKSAKQGGIILTNGQDIRDGLIEIVWRHPLVPR